MNDISPEALRAILEGGAKSGELDPEIEQMKEMIAQLRERGGPPQGRTVRDGIYVASSPLEHLGSFANNMVGSMKGSEMTDLRKRQAGIRSNQNSQVLDSLLSPSKQDPSAGTGFNPDPYAQFRMTGA